MIFAVSVAQPTTQAASIINTVKCNSLALFASASVSALKLGSSAMQTAFELNLNIMKGAWQLEDTAVNALRTVGKSAFTGALDTFQNRPGVFIKNTEVRTKAVETYKTTMLDALSDHQINIDAARAIYREDMLALVIAHQEVLTGLVATLTTTITDAVNVAKENCSKPGVVATLTGVIAKANATLLAKGIAEDVRSLAKAVVLVTTRNKSFIKEELAFLKTSVSATADLAAAFLTRK